jgi:hypothetical protein
MRHLPITAMLTLSIIPAAFAVPPYYPNVVTDGNYWSITAYDDSATVHTQWATQNICFFQQGVIGTHTYGIWYSTTFYDWNGTWRQEGDQVFMTGDYAGDIQGNAVGHDGIQWEIVTSSKTNEGYGHWKEWRENRFFGQVIGYANTKLRRIGSCPFQVGTGLTPDQIEKLVTEQSQLAPRRYRSDGSEALGPSDPKQVAVQ